MKELPKLDHDAPKKTLITPNKTYMHILSIASAEGRVLKKATNKFAQINHYIEMLSPMLRLMNLDTIKVADMASGKGYLTFALYDYLINILKLNAYVTGIEQRPELVEFCNKAAVSSEFANLNFVEGTITDVDASGTNVLIALHACDTATDDAIYIGVKEQAELIVVAPCCHKQIRKEIESCYQVLLICIKQRINYYENFKNMRFFDGVSNLIKIIRVIANSISVYATINLVIANTSFSPYQ